MRNLMWGTRSPSPQQQRPPQQHQQYHQRLPQQQSPRPQQQSPRPQQPPSQGSYHPFQTLQMPKQPSMGAVKVVPSYGENTPPSGMLSPPKAEGSRHIVSAKSPSSQMVKSPPQLIAKTTPTSKHHAIIVPIESPGRSSSASNDGGMHRAHVQNSPSNVATGNDDSPQKPLIPFGNSHAVNNNRMSPSTAWRGSGGAGAGGGGRNPRQPPQASKDLPSRPIYQQEQQQAQQLSSSTPSTHRPEIRKAKDFNDPTEASNAEVQALRSEIARLKNLTADEERIEQNRAELRRELLAAEELMKGQAGKEAQIIQLQSALITAENKGYMTQQRLEEVERQLRDKDAVIEREAEELRAGCRAEVEKMEEMLSDVCGELDIVKTGAKGVQAENSKLRSAIAQLEEEVQALTRANEEGAGGSKAKELEGRVVELEGLLDCERRARAEAEEEARKMRLFAEAKQKEAELANFSALAAVREAEELEEQIRNSHSHSHSHDKHSGSTPGHQHQRPCPTQTPTSHQAASPAPALIPGTHPSWNEAQCLLPPSSPSPPPADVSPYSSFWPFSAISQGSDPTLSPIPTPPPRQGECVNQAAPSPPLPAPSAPREMPEGGRIKFRLFEVGSGSEAAGVVDVERGTNFEQFRAECMAAIGCGIQHFRYNDERTQRFGLECKNDADWGELQRSANSNDCTNLLAVCKPLSLRAHGEVQC